MIQKFLIIILVLLMVLFLLNNIKSLTNKNNKNKNRNYLESFSNININNDFYLTNENSIDLNNKSINTRKICIFKREPESEDSDKLKVTDYECIDANDLLTSLKLPDYKKNTICVDNNCLHKSDLEFMKGDKSFKLKNASNDSAYKDKCVGHVMPIKLKRCGANTLDALNPSFREEYWNNMAIRSLSSIDCNADAAWNYRLVEGLNSDKNLKRNDKFEYEQQIIPDEPINFIPGHT